MHVMPSKIPTWGQYTKSGFYLGTSWDHYRCHRVWIKDTKSTRVGQTVFFRHKYITKPAITPTDAILRETDDLCDMLRGKQIVKSATRSAIDMLVDIFKGYKGEPTKIDDQRADMRKLPQKR